MVTVESLIFVFAGVVVGAFGFVVFHLLSIFGRTYPFETRQAWIYLLSLLGYVFILEISDLDIVSSSSQDLIYYILITVSTILGASIYKLYFIYNPYGGPSPND